MIPCPTQQTAQKMHRHLVSFVQPKAVDADSVSATLRDMGGPLEAQADIRYTPASRTGLLSGTIKERADATPALRAEVANLAQMRPRDSLGRIPVEFEFAL